MDAIGSADAQDACLGEELLNDENAPEFYRMRLHSRIAFMNASDGSA
jgi:hypothetical protein